MLRERTFSIGNFSGSQTSRGTSIAFALMSLMRRTALLLAIYLIRAVQPGAGQQPNGSQQHEATPGPDRGAAVISETLAVQVMLDRAGFSPGEIDAQHGSNLKRALAAYQAARGMPASGANDQATWQRLHQDTGSQPPLIAYTL